MSNIDNFFKELGGLCAQFDVDFNFDVNSADRIIIETNLKFNKKTSSYEIEKPKLKEEDYDNINDMITF